MSGTSNTPTTGATGKTDFTGIVNALQMLAQAIGQNGKALDAIKAALPGSLPAPSPGNALDMVRINAGGTAYEIRTPAQVLSDVGAAALAGSSSQNFSVADATTAHHAVAFEQVKNTIGVSVDSVTTAAALTVTTGTFTAPSTGILMIFGDGVLASPFNGGTLLTTSLAGFVNMGSHVISPSLYARGYLPMTTSQTTTCSFNATMNASNTIALTISTFFLPLA